MQDIYKRIELQRSLSKLEETIKDRETFIKLLVERTAMLQSLQAQDKAPDNAAELIDNMKRRVIDARIDIVDVNKQIVDIRNQLTGNVATPPTTSTRK